MIPTRTTLTPHGNSDARAIRNALRFANEAASSGMLDSIRMTAHRGR